MPVSTSSQTAGQMLWRHRARHKTDLPTDFYLTHQSMLEQDKRDKKNKRMDKEVEERMDEFYLLCGSVEISIEDYFNRR